MKPGEFGAAQFELLVPLFFDPDVDLPAPKPRIPQLHFLDAGGDGRARLMIPSDEFAFAVSIPPEPPSSPLRGGRYVLIIHFYVESGQKMIQFNIQFKIESKIFIQ